MITRQELEEDANEWDRRGRENSALYRGNRLAEALRWKASSPDGPSLSQAASTFLTASSRQERRLARIRRAAVAALAALTLVASVAAVYAGNESATRPSETTPSLK